MAKTMLAVLICLLYVSSRAQGLPESQSADRIDFTVGHSSGVREETGKVFGANAYAQATCNYASDTSAYRNCTATVTHFDQHRIVGTHMCGVGKLIQPMTGRQEHQIRFSFQKNKAIFAYESEDGNRLFQNFRIVEARSDSCSRSGASIILGSHMTFIRQMNIARHSNIIVRDDDQYDVITDGDCDAARCMHTFDSKAQEISGPVGYLPKDYRNHSVKVFPSTKSEAHFAIVGEWPRQFREQHLTTQMYLTEHAFHSETLFFVQGGTESTKLATFDHGGLPFYDIFVDNSNGLFAFCRNTHIGESQERNYKLHCLQFSESTVKFNATLSIDNSERLLAIYNLPDEGIIVVKSQCKTDSTCVGLTLEKWTADPTNQLLLSVKDAAFTSKIVKTIVHVEEGNQMCVTVYSEEAKPPGGYDVFHVCFSNPFFTGGASPPTYISITYLFTCVAIIRYFFW